MESIENQESRNPLMTKLLDSLQKLKHDGFTIKFCWIPSHVGIRGNESADQLAKSALQYDHPSNSKIPYTDLILDVKRYIHHEWQDHYDMEHFYNRPIKLHHIVPTIRPFFTNGLNRRDEQIIHRLRIGHTRLTHSYLMEGLKQVPQCHYCKSDLLSVFHIMIECEYFDRIRSGFYSASDMKELFENYSLKNILAFLKQAGLYQLL